VKKSSVTNPDRIVYQLSVEDIQAVANEELDRDLLENEIALLENKTAENINWYDAIRGAINDCSAEKVEN